MKRAAKRKPKSADKSATTLARQVIEAPRAFAPKEARKRVAQWLAEISRSEAGRALKRLVAASPKVEPILASIADGSPFLWDLIVADPARLVTILDSDPDAHFSALLRDAA